MTLAEKHKKLKALNLTGMDVFLAIIKTYKDGRETVYNPRYVQINERLANRLRAIVQDKIKPVDNLEAYALDCPEPEPDQARVLEAAGTDFDKIMLKLNALNPEIDVVKDVKELVTAKSYLIILRNEDGIQVIGYKNLPENWKLKKDKNLITLAFKGDRFEDLEFDNVFSISGTLDALLYDNDLYIFSKKEFEKGLNFREGMLAIASELYLSAEEEKVFTDMTLLKSRVGNNQRYLRKIAKIKELGYYKDKTYLAKLDKLCQARKWNIQFEDGQIVLTEETLDDILTLLQNKRLHSEITDEIFDVDSAKKLTGSK